MANLAQGWINHLRRQAKNDQPAATDIREDAAPRLLVGSQAAGGDPICEDLAPARQRLKTPTSSIKEGDRTRSPSPNRRSKPKQTTADESTADFPARPVPRTKGRLWNEGDPIPTRGDPIPNIPIPQGPPQHHPRESQRREDNRVSSPAAEEEDPAVNTMVGQPETRSISQEQLLAELKGIYTGAVILESKCIEMGNFSSTQNDPSHQWQAAMAVYQTLLLEHHDYSFTSQHRPESLALRFASRYSMPRMMWHHEICVHLGLESHMPPDSPEHVLAYSMLGLHDNTAPHHHGFFNEGAHALDPKSNNLRHYHKVGSMIPPGIEEPPAEWSLFRLLWADRILPGDHSKRSKSGMFDEDGRQSEDLPPNDSRGRVPWDRSKDGYRTSPGLSSEACDNLQSMVHTDDLFTPGYYLIPLSVLSNIPSRYQLLAIIAFAAIPIVSANVGIMEWTFGILASIPSTYVLANPPVPPSVENDAEQILWKIARAWGLTFGLVFAALLVTRLRTKYPSDKQMYFVSLVFATSLTVMLLLLHFMTDGTWNVLGLLSLCICFCATATYIATSESRGRDTVARHRDEEEGAYHYHQDTPARSQSDQHTRAQGGHQHGS